MRFLAPGVCLSLIACSSLDTDGPVDLLGLPSLRLSTVEHWQQARRAEILASFEQHVYGRTPVDLGRPAFEILAVKGDALDGIATRKFIRITLPRYPTWEGIELMLYLPNAARSEPAPCFVGLSFGGNHAVSTETDVPVTQRWMRATRNEHVVDNRSTEASRGRESRRWPLKMILDRGFAVATAYYGDIEPDHKNGWRDGLRGKSAALGSETFWQEGEWGAIGAWAYGLHLIADYLEYEQSVDHARLAVIGHSRLGKTSLWAGAQDQRFSIVVSNNSGEGGASLMRHPVGETTANITSAFPHWFTPTYKSYGGDPTQCPVDQHMLIALMAPRPVYIASAAGDNWADPEGEFLSGLHASPVYALFDRDGIAVDQWPSVNTPVGGSIGYHMRTGKHDVTNYDWTQYLDFAKRHWGR